MGVEIYADLVFLINFVMDTLILWIVGKLVKRKIKFGKILLGGFIGSLAFCLIIFVDKLRFLYNIPIMIILIMIGISISFKPKSILEFLKLVVLAHISAFCVGGMGIALFYFTNISNIIGNMVGFYVEDFSLKILLIASSSTYIFIKLTIGWFKRIFIKKQELFFVKIFYNEKDVDLQALLDTGNSLHDPISKSPVIIAEFEKVKPFLPDDLKLLFYENRDNDIMEVISSMDSDFSTRIRMIPFASLGKQNGILIGFRPDKVEIQSDDKILKVEDVIIGIYNFELSKDDSYQGLLNPEVFAS